MRRVRFKRKRKFEGKRKGNEEKGGLLAGAFAISSVSATAFLPISRSPLFSPSFTLPFHMGLLSRHQNHVTKIVRAMSSGNPNFDRPDGKSGARKSAVNKTSCTNDMQRLLGENLRAIGHQRTIDKDMAGHSP